MGNIDLFHSRRTNYNRCEYWVRDERDSSGTPEQWVLMKQSSGHFYAKPVSPKSNQMDVINGVWAFDDNHITLETDDDIVDVVRGCIVKYDDLLWLVETVQKQVHHKESEFNRHLDYRYTISLRRS